MSGDDPQYLKHLRGLRCCMFDGQCTGVGVEAHHSTRNRGMSQRGSDTEAFPLCLRHHRQFHDGAGDFKGWDRAQRRAFQDAMSAKYRAAYEATLEPSDEVLDAMAGAPSKPHRRLGIAQAPAIPPLQANDPRAVAREFCRELELGDEVALRLERLLRSYERTVF
jgi:hypothetical protein